jgi:aminocarboxymuconate-semialdehyde decarboxylase
MSADGNWEAELDGVVSPPEDGAVDRPFNNWLVNIFDIDRRLHYMAQSGVDMQGLSVHASMLFYAADAETGTKYARTLNDSVAKIVANYPSRFFGLATVPMQDPTRASDELMRAVQILGMKGAVIGSNINGKNLDEQQFRPFFARAEELGVPLFIHPRYVLGEERLRNFAMGPAIGFPTDTTVAVASLIFGGVLDEFPTLKMFLAHGGGTLPYLIGRLDQTWRNQPQVHAKLKAPPSDYLGRFYYDSVVHGQAPLAFLVKSVGAQRVMLGTDYPFYTGEYRPIEQIESLSNVSLEDRNRIIDRNALEYFAL